MVDHGLNCTPLLYDMQWSKNSFTCYTLFSHVSGPKARSAVPQYCAQFTDGVLRLESGHRERGCDHNIQLCIV